MVNIKASLQAIEPKQSDQAITIGISPSECTTILCKNITFQPKGLQSSFQPIIIIAQYKDKDVDLEPNGKTSISYKPNEKERQSMIDQDHGSCSLEGSIIQRVHSIDTQGIGSDQCRRCEKLHCHLLFLDQEIMKLQQLQKQIKGNYRQYFEERRALIDPLDESKNLGKRGRRILISQWLQEIKPICEKGQRQSDILQKLSQGKTAVSFNYKATATYQAVDKEQQQQSKIEIETQSKMKPEEIQAGIQEMMSTSTFPAEKEKSQLSGSLTSEHKSMIERMTPEQRQAYYSKNMKNRKVMAKLKRKK